MKQYEKLLRTYRPENNLPPSLYYSRNLNCRDSNQNLSTAEVAAHNPSSVPPSPPAAQGLPSIPLSDIKQLKKKKRRKSPPIAESPCAARLLIRACSSLFHLKQIHAHLLRRNHFLPDLSLLELYASLSSPSSAFAVASSSRRPSLPLFNVAVRALSKSPLALRLYARMPALSLSPDNYTFPFLLNSCAVAGDLASGTELHSRLLRTGFAGQVHVANALIDMYGKCFQLPLARRAFEEMNQRDIVSGNALLGAHARLGQDMFIAKKVFDEMPQRNVISWNAMVVGHVNAGDLAAARAVFNEIPYRNSVSWTVMILGHCKNGFVDSARELFDEMPQKNLVSWTAMITGYSQSGRSEEALALFREMRRAGVEADAAVMTGVISAVGQLGSVELAGWVGDYVDRQSIERNERVLTALVDMYAKCGDVERAFRLFEEIPSPDAFSYTALINGLASNGHSLDALKVFDEMLEKEIKPDPITLIGVLTACGHAGLVDEGLRYWHAMREDYGMEPRPDHYACVVDMLGRAGRLEEAYEVLRKMPQPPPPHAGALGAMLAACRTHGNVEIAERVAGELFEVEPENTGNYVLLSSIYAEKGLWAEAAGVRKKMRARAEKLPGASWI